MIPVQNIYYMLSYAFQALQTQTYKIWLQKIFIILPNYAQLFLTKALAHS